MDRTNSAPSRRILHAKSARRAAVGLLSTGALLLCCFTLSGEARRAVPHLHRALRANASARPSSPQSKIATGANLGANVMAWQTLKTAQRVATSYAGRADVVAKLQSGAAALAMASADFDADGIADLVIGFASGGHGVLALHRGNLDAFAPQSYQSWLAISQEQFPSPFLPQAEVIDLPEAPEFLVTGDFNGDGDIDILTGASGSGRLYLLIGNGKGKFSAPQAINLPGKLTALAAGEVGVRDGKSDVVAGIQTNNGAAVLVYKGAAGGLSTAAISYPLPQAATQLELADLHGDGLTDVVALAMEVFVIHPTSDGSADTSALVERVPLAGTPRSIAVGGLVWDRQSRNELAVLSQGGIVQVLVMGDLDTRPFTKEEVFVRRTANLRAQLPSERKAPWSGQSEPWNVLKSYGVSAPLTGKVRLMAVSLAHARPLDLMVVDSSDTRLHVQPANTGAGTDAAGGMMVETGDSPAAVLPMRVNVDGRRGLVMVGKSGSAPRVMAPLPDPTYTVNRFDDPASTVAAASTYCNGVSNDCSFRQAVIKANNTLPLGSDNIALPAGTYTLTQIGQHENAAVTGDVDVTDSLTITGSVDGGGNPTSIITGGAGWNDKFISTNKLGVTNANLSINNVIFQNSNNTNASGGGTFDFLGGAVDFYGCGTAGGAGGCTGSLPTASLSITNVRFLNNTAAGCGAGSDCGGGLDSEFGTTTVSTSLFTGNTATLGRGGALTLVGGVETMSVSNSTFNGTNHAAQEGGAIYVDFQNTAGAGNISIHSSIISGNTAGGDGGGIFVNLASGGNTTTATIDQQTVISGNSSATRGGGLTFWGTSNPPSHTSLTLSKVTITGNHANGSGADGGGGIFVLAGGTLNVSFSRIVGNTTTASGKPTGMSIETGADAAASIVNAADNWWGCNTGPSAAPCDTVATVNGASPTATVSPWLFLSLGASPASVFAVPPSNTSSLTADFLHDSSNSAVLLSNINVLLGLPISFTATAGSISAAQTSIQATGTATATFTANTSCAQASASATVDTNPPPTVTTAIAVDCPDLTATKTDNVSGSVPLATGAWTWTINSANISGGTSAPGIFANGQTIVRDDLPSTDITYGSATPGSFVNITNSGSISCSIASNVLTCSANGAPVTIGTGGSFQVSFTATATAAGSYANPTGGSCAVDPDNDVFEFNESNNTCADTVKVVAPPTIAKAFSPTSILVNGISTLTLTLGNPAANTVAESGVAFSDTLAGGLKVASSPNLSSTCGTVTGATSGSTLFSLSGGTIAVNSSCTIKVDVTSATDGLKPNTTGAISSTNGGTGTVSNTANLTVANPPTISKAFGSASIPLNGTTSVSFTITNPNTSLALTGVAFSDSLPSGVQIVSAPAPTNTCGGTLSAAANATSISLSGGGIAINDSCAISVNVTGTTAGVKNNTTGKVTATETGTAGAASNTATLTVVGPPTISKAFGAGSTPINTPVTVTFTINNPNATVGLTGVAFSDTLTGGLQVSGTPGVVNTCSGTVTAAANGGSISLASGAIATGGSCAVTVNVTGTAAGNISNATGAVTSTEGGTGAASNTATINVVAPPTISKAFGVSNIAVNGTTSVTFTLTNPAANTVAESGVAFSDTLTGGLQVASTPGLSNTCGGTFTGATATSTSLSLSGGTIAINSTCAITLNVTGTASGSVNNATSAVSSTNGGTGAVSNTATITIGTPATISKSFSSPGIAIGGTVTLNFTINNPNPSLALTGLAFSDSLPSGVQVAASPLPANSCGGTFATVAASTTVSLSGGSVGANSTCALHVEVTGTTAGTKNNTTDALSSNEGGTGSASNTATLTVFAPPTISKAFGASTVPLNGTVSLSFGISNPNAVILSGVAFTDSLPSGLQVAAIPNVSTTCGGTFTALANATSVSLSGGSVAASASCAISLDVTGTSVGLKSNTTGAISATASGTGAASNTATVTVIGPPTISKAFAAGSIQLNNSTNLNFTVGNPAGNSATLTGVAFVDNLPAGVVVANPSVVSGTCGGGTITATASSSSITLSGASLAVGASCAFSVSVTGTTNGPHVNNTNAVTSANGGTGTFATASITVSSVPVIATQPVSQAICQGANVTFTAAATGAPAPTVQWQVSTDNGAHWFNIFGATSTTLTFPVTLLINGTQYRAVFTNTFGSTNTNAATLTVETQPLVAIQPLDKTAASGSNVSFVAAAIGTPAPTVQWQVSTNGGGTWNNIPGAVSTTLSFTALASQNGNKYRAVFTTPCGTATTHAATLSIATPPAITLNPANQTVCAGLLVSFKAAASGNPAPFVQWQVSTNGGGSWSNIFLANSGTLTFPASASFNGYKYRAVFTNAGGPATTSPATLTVNTEPEITSQPHDQTVTAGHSATFTAAASGRPTPTVQWQVSTNHGGTWNNISGATSATLTFTSSNSQNHNQYRAVFTNTCGHETTYGATLTVKQH